MKLSDKATIGQIKANTGRNKQNELLSGIGAIYPKNWGIMERINYKSFYADPQQYYKGKKELDKFNTSSIL